MIFNKEKTCCFTGHRNIPKGIYYDVRRRVYYVAEQLVKNGIDTFISGAAIGFDLIAAEAITALKITYPHVRLVFAIPCPEHDIKWNDEDRKKFKVLYTQCDFAVLVSNLYTDGCMLKRDRYMVDNSSCCISYCTRSTGGTAYTVRYAEKNGLNRIEISENDSQRRK